MTVRTIGRIGAAEVQDITLCGPNGLQANLLTYGARLAALQVPDRVGRIADIVIGHDQLDHWITSTTFAGATCGRYSNRIAGAQFVLDGKTINLTRNEGDKQLHGGPIGFDKLIWDIASVSETQAVLTTHSPDGDMGYPGALDLRVTFRFDATGRFWIEMQAQTTAPTVVNMVNHAYFNMAGQGSGPVLNQLLRIEAQHYTPVNDSLIPTGEILAVTGSPYDFGTLRPIGQSLPGEMGFDHNYCLSQPLTSKWDSLLRPAAEAVDPASGRRMQIWTTKPGVQFYSGGYMDECLPGKGGSQIGQFAGFALETQYFPDSPNKPQFPSARLNPGETYCHVMAFDFTPSAE
jgi:aldose 1-epimerase